MANLAIKGHATRGEEVIEILQMLGGKNGYHRLAGNIDSFYYYIWEDGHIYQTAMPNNIKTFTIEEFLEKFPYKVGDIVKIPNCDVACRVTNMIWNGIEIEYETTNSEETFFADELQPYKKETMDKANKVVFDANAQCCDIMNHLIKKKNYDRYN